MFTTCGNNGSFKGKGAMRRNLFRVTAAVAGASWISFQGDRKEAAGFDLHLSTDGDYAEVTVESDMPPSGQSSDLAVPNLFVDEVAMKVFNERQKQTEDSAAAKAVRWYVDIAKTRDHSPVYFMTTDLDSGNDAQERGAAFGFDVQVTFPRDGLPRMGFGLIVALDELLLDARRRREYLVWLKAQTLPLPTVVLSYDFQLDQPSVIRPGLLFAARLVDDIFRALRDGYIVLSVAQNIENKVA